MSRWLIIGNSGSGKSTLAERIGGTLNLPAYDLDLVHWHVDGQKRDEDDARERVQKIVGTDAWVIEGVYGWLAETALPRTIRLIWLDLPWSECREGLLKRGLRRGMSDRDQDALLAWAEAYWTRMSPSSFTGHERLYSSFEGGKSRLQSRDKIAAFVR